MRDLYFPEFEDLDELNDQYEEYLFENKQFFTSRFPVEKVFEAKISKLIKMNKSYVSLGGYVRGKTSIESQLKLKLSDDLFELFNNYQLFKSNILREIHKSSSVEELIYYVRKWCEEVRAYAEKWCFSGFDKKDVIVSKSPNEMELLNSFRELNKSEGKISIEVIKNLPSLNPLYREAIRLSLLLKL